MWFWTGFTRVASLSIKELTLRAEMPDTFGVLSWHYGYVRIQSYFHGCREDQTHLTGCYLALVEFLPYPEDERLCVVHFLKNYIQRTESLRKDSKQHRKEDETNLTGCYLAPIEFLPHPEDERLYVVHFLKDYIQRALGRTLNSYLSVMWSKMDFLAQEV